MRFRPSQLTICGLFSGAIRVYCEGQHGMKLMMTFLGTTLIMAAACGRPASEGRDTTDRLAVDSVSPDLGLEFGPKPPAPFEGQGGWLLTHIQAAEYGIKLVRDTSGQSPTTLWLDSLTHRRADGRPHWQVLAVLPIPQPDKGEVLVPLTCRYDGANDPNLVAILRDDGTELLTDVRLAVRVAVELPGFVPVEPERVTCVREIP